MESESRTLESGSAVKLTKKREVFEQAGIRKMVYTTAIFMMIQSFMQMPGLFQWIE